MPYAEPELTYSVNDIVAYIMHTPENVNPSILLEMLNNIETSQEEEEGISK